MCSTVGYVGVMNTLECHTNCLLVAIVDYVVTETILDYITFYHLGIEKLTFEPISM